MHNGLLTGHKISFLTRIHDKIRYNLILQVIKNFLADIGLEFTLYYMFQEKINEYQPPEIKGNFSDISVEFLVEADMKTISTNARGYSEMLFLTRLKNGEICLGLKYKGEIVSFEWFNFNEFYFGHDKFKLKENEAYITSTYTMEQYRGYNMAPYLKYHSFKILKELGKDTFYSITEYFNTSALKYKKKLNSKKIKFVLYIRLFKKFRWSFTLKTY